MLGSIVALALFIAVAYGLVYWAYRGETDRSARVGIYLVYGIPGTLLLVAGLVSTIYGRSNGPVLFAIGLGLVLPLYGGFRRLVAVFSPLDPSSATDLSGLCVLLAVMFYVFVTSVMNNGPESVNSSVSDSYLIVTVLTYVGLAFAAVGYGFRRTFGESVARLGLRRPSGRIVAIAVGFVFISLVISGIASALTAAVQPDVSDKIQQSLQNMTSDVQNPIGAVILGLSAGIGEEIFFRGAIQPRYGIALTSMLFAVLHTQYGLSVTSLGILGIGVMLGYERNKYGTPASMITHAIFNIISVIALTHS